MRNFRCDCGGGTHVFDTRAKIDVVSKELYVRRRRECIKCGKRFSTVEMLAVSSTRGRSVFTVARRSEQKKLAATLRRLAYQLDKEILE
jgi:transcriptional regulator NrdR family protein